MPKYNIYISLSVSTFLVYASTENIHEKYYKIYSSNEKTPNKKYDDESMFKLSWKPFYQTDITSDASKYYLHRPPFLYDDLHAQKKPHHIYTTHFDRIKDTYPNQNGDIYLSKNRKKKKKNFFRNKQFITPLLTLLAQLFHSIHIFKITLFGLFMLILFSKKAFLISVGSLILVIYDNFYKGNQGNKYVPHRDMYKTTSQGYYRGASYQDCWDDHQARPFTVNPWEINEGLSKKNVRFRNKYSTINNN